MVTYVIGDVHGCFNELQQLLTVINFNPTMDKLWFTGDLVNGGTQSVETLSFIKELGDSAICVLGNHDLTLLGMAFAGIQINHEQEINQRNTKKSGYAEILVHPNSHALLTWLKARPLIHYDPTFNTLLIHAGIAPQWSLTKALQLGQEIENILASVHAADFLRNMFGNYPSIWHDDLTGWDRARCIVNYLTRLRFCTPAGELNFTAKGAAISAPTGTMPWFAVPNRQAQAVSMVFGHWAALNGNTDINHALNGKTNNGKTNGRVFAIDTGCVWGNKLTALRLEDQQYFSVNSGIKNI